MAAGKKNAYAVASDRSRNDTLSSTQSIQKSKKEVIKVVLCILIMELCERLTYYSIVSNMMLFCNSNLGYNSDVANYITQIFGLEK